MSEVKVKRLLKSNVKEIVNLDCEFIKPGRKKLIEKLINCNFKAFPKIQYFTAVLNKEVIGYILWEEETNFDKKAVFRIKKLLVKSVLDSREIETELIIKSLPKIKKYLKKRGSFLQCILIVISVKDPREDIFRSTLNTCAECVIGDLCGQDKLIMIARLNK